MKRPRGLDSTREGGGDDAEAAPYRGCLDCRIVAGQGAGTRFSLLFDKTFLPELLGTTGRRMMAGAGLWELLEA